MDLRITSYNCRGLKTSINDVQDLCSVSDNVFLQETWLLPHEITMLSHLHPDFDCNGSSAVTIDQGVIEGRPHGGLAVLWRKILTP
jgi:hypothetical protein